jgi:hypothetical protein
MNPNVTAAFFGFVGTAIGGLISWALQAQRNKHDLNILRETHKAEFAAETTARHYLESERFTDRSSWSRGGSFNSLPASYITKRALRQGANPATSYEVSFHKCNLLAAR